MFDSWTSTVQFLLVECLIVGSTLVWVTIATRFQAGQPVLERHIDPVRPVPTVVVLGVIGWLTLQFVNRLSAQSDKMTSIPLVAIQWMAAIHLFIAAVLPLLLTDGGKWRLSEVGLSLASWRQQLRVGVLGFLAAVGPTGLLLITSRFWRTVDTQHAYLQTLRETVDGELITWIAVSAVIAAPLAEEVLFRVVLQGWLSERLPGPATIGTTAVVFSLVHGWRDALPLIPLSLILGIIYHRKHHYWSCVVTHALFNSANLALVLLGTNPAS